MPDVIKAALSTTLELATANSNVEAPQELQYMPPGTHRISASRGGKPITLDITVDASTADRLNQFLQDQLTKATEGNDDRPFFDFNHEDREAAAWPTEFYWAGDDPKAGGVRAKIEWSGAGEKAVKEKTFRRFSPTFVPDEAGHVIGSETNMGGLVNRAAFKTIAPLFAKGGTTSVSSAAPDSDAPPTQVSSLRSHPSNLILPPSLDPSTVQAIETRIDLTLDLVHAAWSDEARAASERARRALGWPGLSQTWGDGHGGAGPTKPPKPISDPKAPDGDSDSDFQEEERRTMDELRRRELERQEKLEQEERPTGDADPDFQRDEQRSIDEHRERERQRQEEDTRSQDEPGQTFEEIASDPQTLRQLSDEDIREFQYFTEGETRRRFQEEEARRRVQVLPKAN